AAADQVPAADGAQPVRGRHRRAAAGGRLGRGDRFGGSVAADDRPDAARRAAQPGHVPRRLVPHVPGAADGRRAVPVGPRAGGARPGHPARRDGGAMTTATDGTASGTAVARPGREPIPHEVSDEPFDPAAVEELTPEQERYYMASQWRIMWWRFRRHRVAVVSAVVLLAMYASILVSEVLAPYDLHTRNIEFIFAPPQRVHLFHEGEFIGPRSEARRGGK